MFLRRLVQGVWIPFGFQRMKIEGKPKVKKTERAIRVGNWWRIVAYDADGFVLNQKGGGVEILSRAPGTCGRRRGTRASSG
ncbi:MAG: hypothetical protein HC902_12205 [Calothrix sp. SM1_5_4]|nr:hypothetical protein [Calothrix sp. SM1_5_4]